MKFIFHTISAVLLTILLVGCTKDNFIDPNDPRFDSEAKGITLDFAKTYQTIDHFGASDAWSADWIGKWPSNNKEEMAKLLFSSGLDGQGNPEGIGLSKWRFNVGEGAGDQEDSGYRADVWKRESKCFLNEDGTYDWSKQEGARWFLGKAKEYGVPSVTAWVNCPPYFMTQNGYTFRTDGVNNYNLDPARTEDFATYLATVMNHFKDQGINITELSPFNEPQYEWKFKVGEATQAGSKATNFDISRITKVINDKFIEKNVATKILIPEAGQLQYLFEGSDVSSNQIEQFFDPSSTNFLGNLESVSNTVAAHSYFINQDLATAIEYRKRLGAKVQEKVGLSYWQTEYSLLGNAYLQGEAPGSLQPIDYALWITRIMHFDLVHANAAGWSWWSSMNNSTWMDHPNRFNLLLWIPNQNGPNHTDGTYEVIKNLWAVGNFSRFVRPGMVRFHVDDDAFSDDLTAAKNFLISGYKNDAGDLVLVCINYSDDSRKVNLANYGTDFSIANEAFTGYLTSSTSNLKSRTIPVDEISVPGKSILTLTAKLK